MLKRLLIISASMLLVAGQSRAQTSDRAITYKGATLIGHPTTREMKLEKAAYLGIATGNASPVLQEQLKLKPGVGLVVERVEPNSPAEQAGIKQYDVLEKLDDQWLINSEQFAVLVRMHEPGNQIKLSIIRQGQPQVVTAQLIEKEVPPLPMYGAIKLGDGTLTFTGNTISDIGPLQPGAAITLTGPNDAMLLRTTDSNYSISISRKDGSMHLKASDLAGNVIYDGPIDTEQQWQAVPQDVAARAKKLMAQMKIEQLLQQKKPASPVSP